MQNHLKFVSILHPHTHDTESDDVCPVLREPMADPASTGCDSKHYVSPEALEGLLFHEISDRCPSCRGETHTDVIQKEIFSKMGIWIKAFVTKNFLADQRKAEQSVLNFKTAPKSFPNTAAHTYYFDKENDFSDNLLYKIDHRLFELCRIAFAQENALSAFQGLVESSIQIYQQTHQDLTKNDIRRIETIAHDCKRYVPWMMARYIARCDKKQWFSFEGK